MKEFKTLDSLDEASRAELCEFLTTHSGIHITDDQNEEALREDAQSVLQEMVDKGEIVYIFDELSRDAKSKVIDWLAPDHSWWKDSLDYFQEMAKARGLTLESFRWYGDQGTAWEGWINLKEYFAATYAEEKDAYKRLVLETLVDNDNMESSLRVAENSNDCTYVHDLDYDFEDTPTIDVEGLMSGANVLELIESLGGTYDKVMADLEVEIQEAVDVLCHDMAACLRKEEEHYQSEEYAQDMCEANDYVFDADGGIADKPTPVDKLSTTDSQLSLAIETSGE